MDRSRYDSLELSGSLLEGVKRCTTILIVTAAIPENNAVVEKLKECPLPFNKAQNGEPKVGVVHTSPLFHVVLFEGFLIAHLHLTDLGGNTLQLSISEVRGAMPNIKLIIMPGMAFGLHSNTFILDGEDQSDGVPFDKKGQQIGDIIVATEVIDTTLRDPSEPDKLARMPSRSTPIYPDIVNHLEEYAGMYQSSNGEKVFFGPFLHVPQVVDDKQWRKELREKYGQLKNGEINALAGEMEGQALTNFGQFYTRNPSRTQVYVVLAKAICDWGFGKPQWDDDRRPQHDKERLTASQNSFAFIMHVLRNLSQTTWIEGVKKFDQACLNWRPPGHIVVKTGERGDSTDEIEKWRSIRNDASYPDSIRVSTYVQQLLGNGEPLRCLVITGRGGIGKTFFAKQIRLELCEQTTSSGRHLWLDCPSNLPTVQTLLASLCALLPEDQIDDFKMKTQHYLDKDGEQDAFKANSGLYKYLMANVMSEQFAPLYFYFDDLNSYISDLKRSESAFGSFFNAFLQEDTSLRVIATSRTDRLDNDIRKLVGGKRNDIKDTGKSLPPFVENIVRDYLEIRGGIKSYLSDADFDTFLELAEGDPLALDGVEDIFKKANDSNPDEEDITALAIFERELKSLLEKHKIKPLTKGKRFEEVRSLVYKSVVNSWPRITQRAAEALAVLNDPNFVPFAWPEEDALSMSLLRSVIRAEGENISDEDIDIGIEELRDSRKVTADNAFYVLR